MAKTIFTVDEYLQRIDARQQNIENMLLSQKKALTFDEAAIFAGVSKSHLYKLTSSKQVPFYCPRGKMNYFDRDELSLWLLQNRVTPADEIEAQASTYIATGRIDTPAIKTKGRKGVSHV